MYELRVDNPAIEWRTVIFRAMMVIKGLAPPLTAGGSYNSGLVQFNADTDLFQNGHGHTQILLSITNAV
jgi:hypothetical protein